MSKVAIITDQHFGARNDSVNFLDFFEKFYDEVFFPKLKEEGIDDVLILGDTFDRRKYVNFYTLERTKKMFFDRLRDAVANPAPPVRQGGERTAEPGSPPPPFFDPEPVPGKP